MVNNATNRNGLVPSGLASSGLASSGFTPSGFMPSDIASSNAPSIEPSMLTSVDLEQVALFLTLPGIVGFAVVETKRDRSFSPDSFSPDCYFWDEGLVLAQPELWISSLAQVVRSMPDEVKQIEFIFAHYRFYIRRLVAVAEGLLVIQDVYSPSLRQQEAIVEPFCEIFSRNRSAVLQILRQYHPMIESRTEAITPGPPISDAPISDAPISDALILEESILEDLTPARSALQRHKVVGVLNDWFASIRYYLGQSWLNRALVRSQVPEVFLPAFRFDRSGQLSWAGPEFLSMEEVTLLALWLKDFQQDCSKILRNLDRLTPIEGLTEEELQMLGLDPR